MKRADLRNIGLLLLATLVIFYPVFYSHYFYSDEAQQLWLYRKGSGFAMFRPQGRLITESLCRALYSSIDTIRDLSWLRIFSLAGWLLCLPLWYGIFARICRKEELPALLPFFIVLFLVTSPPFSVSIQWCACMELFIANTSGLLAGYLVWSHITYADGRVRLPFGWALLSLALGLVSLFTYQNGFGCFLLPFFLQAIAQKKIPRPARVALALYFLTYGVYFLLFKGYIMMTGIAASGRTALLTNPFPKAYYLFTKTLPGAFYFNVIVPERSWIGRVNFILVALGCLAINFLTQGTIARSGKYRLGYAASLLTAFILIYLPSLLVQENYASNRTLLALDMAVFIWVFTTLLDWIADGRRHQLFAALVGILLIAGSWYNYRFLFLRPAIDEYTRMRDYIGSRYQPGITSVQYIRTGEDEVRKKYHIRSSWDEFGFSSSYFVWVPEFLVKQLVMEKTGSRDTAGRIVIRSWADRQAWIAAGSPQPPGALLIDAASILQY